MLGGDEILVMSDCLTAEDRLVAVGVDDGVFPVLSDVEDMTYGGSGPGGMDIRG
jgi:hypothetical protein